MHGLGTLRRNPEGARKRDEVDLGIKQFRADIAVGLLGEPAHGMQALLEDAIRAVIEDHEDRANAIMRGGPQPLTGIHRAAVTYEPDHRPIGQGDLYTDRGRQSPADATAAQAEITLRIIAADELANAGCGRERLLDDDGVLRQRLPDRV